MLFKLNTQQVFILNTIIYIDWTCLYYMWIAYSITNVCLYCMRCAYLLCRKLLQYKKLCTAWFSVITKIHRRIIWLLKNIHKQKAVENPPAIVFRFLIGKQCNNFEHTTLILTSIDWSLSLVSGVACSRSMSIDTDRLS